VNPGASFVPGALFVDQRFGYLGIILEQVSPAQGWIDAHQEPEFRALSPHDVWCRVALLNSTSGPPVRVMPARFATARTTEFHEFLAAIDHADESTRRALARVLPEYARRALADALGDREG